MRKTILSYCSGLSFFISEMILDKAPERDVVAMSTILTVLIEIASVEWHNPGSELTEEDILSIIDNAGVVVDIDRVIELCETVYANQDLIPPTFVNFLKLQKEQLSK